MASIFHQKYTVKDENGKTIRKQSQYWYIDYKTADGTRKRVRAFKDKTATCQLAAKLEKESELAQAGIIDRYKEHRKRPLIEHLADFKASLTNKGTTEKHACLVYNRAKAVIENCGFVYMGDISASKVQRYLAERRGGGLGIRSSNFYLQAIKQFCRWLVADNRTAESSLAYLSGQNPKTDIRHARRALDADELERLITSTLKGQKHSGMTGKERAMLYMLAVSTGLRASELASLTWQSFNLNDSMPSVKVLAAYSKHRRDDTLPLRCDIAKQLALWKAESNPDESAGAGGRVFADFQPNKAAKMLSKDLQTAGIPYRDEAGRVADFHSLRHTFISSLTRSGVSPKVAQSLARHSTIGLTMDTYTHIGLYDERAAVDSLPKLPVLNLNESSADEAVAVRTGTDDVKVTGDKSAYKCAYKKLAKNAYPDSDRSSATVNEQDAKQKSAQSYKSLGATKLGSETNHLSTLVTGETDRRRWDSNPRITVLQTVALVHLATPP